jgi:pantoate--beta-alanine ligase
MSLLAETPGESANKLMIVETRAGLVKARHELPGTVAVVMTMGALHDGHLALLKAARRDNDRVIVTIFVNPLQFGPHEDFARYPRTLDSDLDLCREVGVDLVFVPSRGEIYPDGQPAVRVNPGPRGEELEGASRPGFFHGVLTVVLKLLHLTMPDRAYFGEKDYQQLILVRRMVRDLDLSVEIVGVPTVREPDGLALSSRNRYLSPVEREQALALSRALREGATAARYGAGAAGTLAAAIKAFEAFAGAELDYLALTTPDLEPPPDDYRGPGRLLVAARVGTTRLIDNGPVEL